jgi:CO/xanthine dehydrogenase FAD-binding subunit
MDTDTRPLPSFVYLTPGSLAEVLGLLRQHGDTARPLAGGTDLLVWMKKGVLSPKVILDLNNVRELSFIETRGNDLCVGSATRLTEIRESKVVQEKAPLLAEAIGHLACQPVRNRATIGGNLCSASPAADTAPPLLALDASVILESTEGERKMALSAFFSGPGQTQRKPTEILKQVVIPIRKGRSDFVKLGRRKGLTLSIASVAAFVDVQNGRFADARLAVGAVSPVPLICKKAQERLIGAPATEETIDKASETAKTEVSPITDVRATAAYRREMVGVLTRRVLKKLIQERG